MLGTYNNGFPIGYPYIQAPTYQPPAPSPIPAPQQDIVNTNIVPIDDLKEIDKFHLDSGASLMFMTRDNQTIYIKSAIGNGLYTLNTYRLDNNEEKHEETATAKYLTVEDAEKMFAEWEQRMSSKVRANKKGE